MAQEHTMTMTWMVLGELCRCLLVVRVLREFEGRLKVQAYCHRLGLTVRLPCVALFSWCVNNPG